MRAQHSVVTFPTLLIRHLPLLPGACNVSVIAVAAQMARALLVKFEPNSEIIELSFE